MTFEEVWLWCAYFQLMGEQQEEANRKAQRLRR
jgi:hypothetical protein